MTISRSRRVNPDLIAFAHRLADASGPVVMRYFRKNLPVEVKSDSTPVTLADREAESVIRQLIYDHHPDHGVVGEEHAAVQPDAEFVWVIDPIDGTKSFITGRPLFGTLIALMWEGEPVLGIVDHPALGDRWIGAIGHPTTMNGNTVRVRSCSDLGEATLLASSPHYYLGESLERFERVRQRCQYVVYGSECLEYGLLASGFVDIVTEAQLEPFDYLAAVPVIEGAGGVITDWQGRRLGLTSGDKILAVGDAGVHEKILSILST